MITFPLSEEIFSKLDEINQEDYTVDVSQIDFGEDDNIESTLIYMRNLQLHMPLDFSNIDYNTKLKWLNTYLTSNYDVTIKELDETLLTILAGENIGLKCIFTDDEIKDIYYDDIITFIISIYDIAIILLKRADKDLLDYKVDCEVIKEKPKFFDCLIHIIDNYPEVIEALIGKNISKYEHKVYHYALEHITKHDEFRTAIMKIPTIFLLGWIYGFDKNE